MHFFLTNVYLAAKRSDVVNLAQENGKGLFLI